MIGYINDSSSRIWISIVPLRLDSRRLCWHFNLSFDFIYILRPTSFCPSFLYKEMKYSLDSKYNVDITNSDRNFPDPKSSLSSLLPIDESKSWFVCLQESQWSSPSASIEGLRGDFLTTENRSFTTVESDERHAIHFSNGHNY